MHILLMAREARPRRSGEAVSNVMMFARWGKTGELGPEDAAESLGRLAEREILRVDRWGDITLTKKGEAWLDHFGESLQEPA
jgi:hypothetical protein